MTTALVTGVSGQDGLYLAAHLKRLGYTVAGLSPWGTVAEQRRVRDIVGDIELFSCDVTDTSSLARVIDEVEPEQIYNLAGISSVRVAWDMPLRGADVNGLGVLRLLETVRRTNPGIRVFQASSVQMFGEIDDDSYREDTPIRPASPYGAAKAFGHAMANIYRERHGMFVSCAVFGNHESPLQDEEFLLRHVCGGVGRILAGKQDVLPMRSLEGVRDWGYAGDYVRALPMMLRHDRPDDFVIATGLTHSVVDVLTTAFGSAGIHDWRPYVSVTSKNTGQTRRGAKGDFSKAREHLGWSPRVTFEELIAAMVFDKDPGGLVH